MKRCPPGSLRRVTLGLFLAIAMLAQSFQRFGLRGIPCEEDVLSELKGFLAYVQTLRLHEPPKAQRLLSRSGACSTIDVPAVHVCVQTLSILLWSPDPCPSQTTRPLQSLLSSANTSSRN